jgi:hypothetical protein
MTQLPKGNHCDERAGSEFGKLGLKFQVITTDLERIKQHQDDRICRGEIEGIGGEAIIHGRPTFTESNPGIGTSSKAGVRLESFEFFHQRRAGAAPSTWRISPLT